MRRRPARRSTLPILCGALAALAFWPAALRAQSVPQVLPSRDVEVVYRLAGSAAKDVPGGDPGEVTLSWNAQAQRLRATASRRPQVALVDLRGGTALVLDPRVRTALAVPLRQTDIAAFTLRGARLSRSGNGVVAGHACTRYDVQAATGTGSVCLTRDGLALSGQGVVRGRQGSFTATRVVYGPLPDALFHAPEGYLSLDFGRWGRAQWPSPQ